MLGRPTGQLIHGPEGPSKALAEATEIDQGQMLCFLRRLDKDDDAHVTLESFCLRMVKQGGGWTVARKAVLQDDALKEPDPPAEQDESMNAASPEL